jgi:hypothetical protein
MLECFQERFHRMDLLRHCLPCQVR